jgi:hypothetical protein
MSSPAYEPRQLTLTGTGFFDRIINDLYSSSGFKLAAYPLPPRLPELLANQSKAGPASNQVTASCGTDDGPARFFSHRRRSTMPSAHPYQVETVETCRAPSGLAEDNWCRYILTNSQSRVVGRYRGTLKQTRRNAETLADQLNNRLRKGYSPWAARGRKTARA